MGTAFSHYRGFAREKIEIVAGFDIDPSKCQSLKGEIPIFPISEMAAFVKKEGIEIGIITVPEVVANEVLTTMAEAGIKGVLNFAPVTLKSTDNCIVTTYCVEVELENLIYYVNERDDENAEDSN